MKRLLSWSIGIALLLVTFVAPPLLLADNNLPQPNDDFYLLDQANFFSASASAQFIANSKELAQQTGTQIVTVVLPTLPEDENLEEYAIKLFRAWGIGDKQKNNGLLFLIIAESQKIRVEVGYGLEEFLPDGVAGTLIRHQFAPHFRQKDYDGGLLAAQQTVIDMLRGEITSDAATNISDEAAAGWLLTLLVVGGILIYSSWKFFTNAKRCPTVVPKYGLIAPRN